MRPPPERCTSVSTKTIPLILNNDLTVPALSTASPLAHRLTESAKHFREAVERLSAGFLLKADPFNHTFLDGKPVSHRVDK